MSTRIPLLHQKWYTIWVGMSGLLHALMKRISCFVHRLQKLMMWPLIEDVHPVSHNVVPDVA